MKRTFNIYMTDRHGPGGRGSSGGDGDEGRHASHVPLRAL